MARLVIVVAVVLVAVVVAELLRRRRSDAPTQPAAVYDAPAQLDRGDFDGIDRDWLVAVFTSATCSTCAETVARASILDSDAVAVAEVEVSTHPEMHRRYGIEAVPIVAIADRDGVVHRSFIGPVSSTHLWGAVAELREPGTVPDCDHDSHGPT
ncbi:MAG: glutaredoxin family protein [Microthrixaceae bacterium]